MMTLKELIEVTPVYGLPHIEGVIPLTMLKDGVIGVYAIRWFRDYIYIGESKCIKSRIIDHLTCANSIKTSKQSVLYSHMHTLLKRGSHFEVEILDVNAEIIDIEKWERLDLEGEWILKLRKDGYNLFNRTHYLK